MTLQDVAHHLQVSWDVVKGIEKRYLLRHFSRPIFSLSFIPPF
jgi:hypothetical protein